MASHRCALFVRIILQNSANCADLWARAFHALSHYSIRSSSPLLHSRASSSPDTWRLCNPLAGVFVCKDLQLLHAGTCSDHIGSSSTRRRLVSVDHPLYAVKRERIKHQFLRPIRFVPASMPSIGSRLSWSSRVFLFKRLTIQR
jgi:hypothetical protein